jgi:cyanophycinase-like exopeptidase
MNAAAGAAPLPRLLCIMGSGETTPTMVSVHADLLARLGTRPVAAVLLDTPFGFQENAGDISEKTVAYFRDRVGFPISVASFRNRELASALEYETMLARVAEARYVFAGPGSPSYALRQWLGTAVPDLLATKLREGGCVTLASAAAVGLGVCSLAVYEVYKVGEEPRWLDGLDLLGATGLRAAVVPHYNNAEGGTHDTRYCYMGERRLRMLEELLPDGVDVLGVDEHTAAIFDLDAMTVTIRGRGGVTWRHKGASQRFESGITIPIGELAAASAPAGDAPRPNGGAPVFMDGDGALPASGASPFLEEVTRQSDVADAALASRDVDGAVGAVLAIDTQIHDWAADTLDSDEQDRARETLRRYVVRLGDLARSGAADPRDLIGPVVDRILDLRVQMRGAGEYALADKLRDALVEAGVAVHDTPAGSSWDLAATIAD